MTQLPSRLGLRTRLRLVAVFTLLALGALAWIRALERRSAEQARLGERARDNAATVSRALDAQIEQVAALLQSLTFVVNPKAPLERNDAVLRTLFRRASMPFANVFATDTLGAIIGTAVLAPNGRRLMDVASRPYFADVRRSNRFTIGSPVRSRVLDGAPWMLPFIAPIPDAESGRTVGYVAATILIDSLEAVRIARQLPNGSVLTVLDRDGTIVVRSLDGDRWIGKRYPGFDPEEQASRKVASDTVVPSDLDKLDRLFGSQFATTVPWRVYVGIPVAYVYAPLAGQFLFDLGIGVLAGAIIVFIAYWVTGNLLRPIESLTRDARAISDGDMSRRSTVTSKDEVGELARTFNAMADAIVERNAKLEASQDRLRSSQKLEALGAFAGGIAHDFNNYLSSIVGHAELAMDDLPDDSQARLEIASALTSAHRAADLTRQILVFSRRQVVSPTNLDVNAALRGMHRLIIRLLGESVTYRSELDASLGSIRIDQGQFEQVVMNLAVNARDAMPEGGKFTIESSRVMQDNTPYVCIVASDSGGGIPAAHRDRIFEPFFTTKERAHGTGLGLSISYSIITGAGGTIDVDSTPGEGARFCILLPEGPKDTRPAAAESNGIPRGNAEMILLVDDDPGVSLVAQRLLRRGGYQVQTAPDAVHAMQLLSTTTFDLLITDVVMPGLSGPQLAREAQQRFGAMRVLFVSGYPDDDLLAYEIATQQAAFLAKPFSQESLLRRVRELLDAPIPSGTEQDPQAGFVAG